MSDVTRTQVPAAGTEPDGIDATVARSHSRETELPLAVEIEAESPVDNEPPTVQASAGGSRPAGGPQSGRFEATVPGYEVLDELGRGAMGVVYRARHTKLNRLVALKMTLGGRVDEKDLIRFLAEAEAVASVKHENVVQVYDYGESGGRPYMALEFCAGGSLAERLRDGDTLSHRVAAKLVSRIAAGVAAAHEVGIVHRDLKPGNILLQVESRKSEGHHAEEPASGVCALTTLRLADMHPKVSDFGLAKRGASELTATQAVMGTPSYMSPEQAGGKTKFVGPQADVWALGVILYECLCGVRPFPGRTTDEVLAQVLRGDPIAVRAHKSSVPRDLDLICRKCLEKNPADRYPSAAELADDLGRFARGEPISARPIGAVPRAVRWARRNPVVAGLMAAVVLITLVLFGSLYAQYQQALTQVDSERQAKEGAERERKQEEIARQNAERATQETKLREEAERQKANAEVLAAQSAAEAAQANVLVELLNDMFRSSDPLAAFFGDAAPVLIGAAPSEARAAVLGPFLRNAAARFRASLTDPAVAPVRAKLLSSIGNAMKNLGMYVEAKPILAEVVALRRANLPDTSPEVWQSEIDLGRLEIETGDPLRALDRFRDVLALQKKGGADRAAVLTTRFYEGVTLTTVGLREAEPVLREVIVEREALLGKAHKDTLFAKLALLAWLLDKQKWTEVMTLFGEFREDMRAHPDERIRDIFEPVLAAEVKIATASLAIQPGSLFASQLRPSIDGLKADIARLEKLVPEDHLVLIVLRFELAKLLYYTGDPAADGLFARIASDVRKTVGLAHPSALPLLGAYSARLIATNRVPEARALLAEFEEANRKRFGPDNPWLTIILLQRARFEYEQRDEKKALESAKGVLAQLDRGKYLPTNGAMMDLFGTARALGGSASPELRAAAREMFVALRPLVAAAHGPKSEEMLVVLLTEGRRALDTGDRAGALAPFAQAHELMRELPKLNPRTRASLLTWSGRLELDRGQFADAEVHFRALHADAKNVPGLSVAEREDNALNLARALAAQGRYKDAIPLFEEARRWTAERKLTEKELAFADMQVATAQLAAGERAEYLKTLEKMVKQYGKSADGNTLARLAWAIGLSGTPEGWDAAAFEAALGASSFRTFTGFPWGFRGVALVRLRAGKLDEVEPTLTKGGPATHAVDYLIRGLTAAARKDYAAARAHLSKAEALLAAEKPGAANPFAYAGRAWNQHIETAILLTELRTAIPAPTVAPPPRVKQ